MPTAQAYLTPSLHLPITAFLPIKPTPLQQCLSGAWKTHWSIHMLCNTERILLPDGNSSVSFTLCWRQWMVATVSISFFLLIWSKPPLPQLCLGLFLSHVWNVNYVFMIFVNQFFTPCFCKLKFLIKRTKNVCLCVWSLFQIIVKIPSGYSSRKSKDHSLQKLRNYVQNFTKQDNTLAEAWLLSRVDSE